MIAVALDADPEGEGVAGPRLLGESLGRRQFRGTFEGQLGGLAGGVESLGFERAWGRHEEVAD